MKKIINLIKKNWKVQLMLTALILSIFAIHPRLSEGGVYIKSTHSPIVSSDLIESAKSGDILININGNEINSLKDFENIKSSILPGNTVNFIVKREIFPYIWKQINTYPFIADEKNNQTNIGIEVSKIPSSNLKFGLDIEGGTEVLLKPKSNITAVQFENTIDVLRERLNLFGLNDIPVMGITDLDGNKFIKVEFAGLKAEEAADLISKEGTFEAKISNITVFSGSDILDVCISGVQCTSTLSPFEYADSGGKSFLGWRFMFQIDISKEAASRFANVTNKLSRGECESDGECYLNATIDFYIDGELIPGSSLRIVEDLKGKEITSPVITGSRQDKTEANNEKRKLQAILQSRKLPVSMEITRTSTVSPMLGEEFVKNIFLTFLISIIFVDIVIFLRYRSFKISLPIIFITLSEIIMTLGLASIINWTLDLSSITGIIAAVGIGVDDQIIISDEVLKGSDDKKRISGWKEKIKSAFWVIISSFMITSIAMLPLLFAGAGMLRGFAITTLMGLVIGVSITRPAFAEILSELLKKD